MVDPTPVLPDETPIDRVRFPTRIHNVLAAAGLKTVGEVRETADETLLSFQNLGPDSVTHLRKTLACRRLMGSGPASRRFGCGAAPTSQAAFGR